MRSISAGRSRTIRCRRMASGGRGNKGVERGAGRGVDGASPRRGLHPQPARPRGFAQQLRVGARRASGAGRSMAEEPWPIRARHEAPLGPTRERMPGAAKKVLEALEGSGRRPVSRAWFDGQDTFIVVLDPACRFFRSGPTALLLLEGRRGDHWFGAGLVAAIKCGRRRAWDDEGATAWRVHSAVYPAVQRSLLQRRHSPKNAVVAAKKKRARRRTLGSAPLAHTALSA